MKTAILRRHRETSNRRRRVVGYLSHFGRTSNGFAPTPTHNVTLTAVNCPSPQTGVSNILLDIAGASKTTAGNAPGLIPTPSLPDWRTAWLQTALTQIVAAIRYGAGGGYAVCKGLDLYSINGLLLGVHAGHATIDVTVPIPESSIAVPDGHDGTAGDRIWIYLSQAKTLSYVPNSIAVPGGNQCLLGSCTTSGGVITSIDYSGVLYAGTGDMYRLTADTTAPTDSPTSLLQFKTRNPSTKQEWKWNGLTHEVIPSTANPLPITAMTGVQPSSAVLTALASVMSATATAAAQRAALGLGTAATHPASDFMGAYPNISEVDASGGPVAAALPAANSLPAGGTIGVQKIDAGAFTVTVTRAGADTINGATTKVISSQWESYLFISDGVSKWRIF